MKKGIIFILLIIFLIFSNTKIVSAFSFEKSFGGKILYTKAMKIQILESAGFTCTVLGSTIMMMPIGSPVGTPIDYFIPWYTISKTKTTLRSGQYILGKYGMTTPITCVSVIGVPIIVDLDTITLFGTSK